MKSCYMQHELSEKIPSKKKFPNNMSMNSKKKSDASSSRVYCKIC
jgi:hypothetical protein